MYTTINKNLVNIILILVVVLSLFLRIYKISENPPSLSWDEAAVGYNAYTIANFGMDEWGNKFPLIFKSFLDYKHPVHIYITSIFVKFLGSSDFSTRLPSAVFGVLNVILIFYLAKIMFKKQWIALFSSLLLAVSPYNIQFSRFNHELNFTVFFFMLGIYLFLYSVKNKFWLSISIISFGLCFVTYHSAKFIVPITFLVLTFLYLKEILKEKIFLIMPIFTILIFTAIVLLNLELLGIARFKQSSFNDEVLIKTEVYKKTHNIFLSKIGITTKQYLTHFSYTYLFKSGDKNPRHSTQFVGEFYKIEFVFLLLGFFTILKLIFVNKNKESILLLTWALLAPIPAALVNEAPHAARAMFMTGSWHIISAFGVVSFINLLNKRIFKIAGLLLLLIIFILEISSYLKYYYSEYPERYAIEWQYGMDQVVDYVKINNQYSPVFVTNLRQQPYIFFLYKLKYSPIKFRKEVMYTKNETKSFNTVHSFGKYVFSWDSIESKPDFGVLYIITPAEFTGLRNFASFDVKKVIKYPDGGDAFYIVTAKITDL